MTADGTAATTSRTDGGLSEGPPRDGSGRRLLLLEFVTPERWVFNSRYYPFVKGAAAAFGFETLWHCYGSHFRLEKTGGGGLQQHMDVEDAEYPALSAAVERLRPTHVMVSHSPSERLLRCVTRGRPDVAVLAMSEHASPAGVVNVYDWLPVLHGEPAGAPAPEPAPEPAGPDPAPRRESLSDPDEAAPGALMARNRWLLTWLGAPDPGAASAAPAADPDGYIVGTFTPDYDAVMANPQARAYRPHVILLGGYACDHRAPVAHNPHFDGVDLDGCTHDFGCAYCTWFRGPTSDMAADPVALAEEQLRRVLETAGPEGRDCGVYDVYDIRLFGRAERFFEMVLRLGVRPSTFCFEPRADRFLQVAPKLERLLPRLAAAGHRIELFRMGLETLVDEENVRYNKHITAEQGDAATRRLRELSAAFPGAFAYDPTWGYITCSPWTTLDNLQTMVTRAIERDFDPLGVWLYTPLLLFSNSPITRLARAEGGILQDEFDDRSLYYEASVNQVAFDSFLKWRFRDPRAGLAFALIVRFCAAALRHKYPDTLFADDPLYRALLDHPALGGVFARPDWFAREAIAVVRAAGDPPWEREAVLDAALRRYAALAPAAPAAQVAASAPADDPAAADRRFRLRFLLDAVAQRLSTDGAAVTSRDAAEERADDAAGAVLRLELDLGGRPYVLRLADPAATPRRFFVTERFAVVHDAATPPRSDEDTRRLRTLVRLLERALERHAPELLPGGGGPGG